MSNEASSATQASNTEVSSAQESADERQARIDLIRAAFDSRVPEFPPQCRADMLVDALTPFASVNVGAAFYRARMRNWLRVLIETEPALDAHLMQRRLQALSEISPALRHDLGPAASRLRDLLKV